jgi:hypothetical protein
LATRGREEGRERQKGRFKKEKIMGILHDVRVPILYACTRLGAASLGKEVNP